MAQEDLEKRQADLQARIDHARTRAEARREMDWNDIGHLLDAINDQVEASQAHPPAARALAYDRLEKDVDALHGKLGGLPPDR